MANAGAACVFLLLAPIADRRDSRSSSGGCVEEGYGIFKVHKDAFIHYNRRSLSESISLEYFFEIL